MTRATIILLFLALATSAQNDKKKDNVITGTADAAKLVLARQKLLAGEYVSALNMYREVLNNDPKDAGTRYHVGLCQARLKKYGEAQKTLEEAALSEKCPPAAHIELARIYQMNEQFDNALSSLQKFKASGSDSKEEQQDADLLLSQCTIGAQLTKDPVDVGIENLGEGVNSKYDDKNPCITADGRSLIFTTRRPETTNSITDMEGDGMYFENIYISSADTASGLFTSASNVSRSINTDAHDACTSISPDGTQIFIYKNDLSSREARGGNVFVSKIAGGKWRKPEPLGKPVNSSYWEGGACISPDGKRYFFSSEREGGYGNSDIWMAEKLNKEEWGKPVNLGPNVNTAYDEAGMFLAPDGKTLFFCSNGPRSMGSYDIFRTVFENGQWSVPENLGYPINSVAKEGQLTISTDASHAYFSSTRKGGIGESDIYRIDLREFAILEKDFKKAGSGLCILKGTIREGNEGYGLPGVDVSVRSASGEESPTTTGDNGEYFYTLKPGQYTLTVAKKGYETITQQVELSPAKRGTSVTEKGYLLKKQ